MDFIYVSNDLRLLAHVSYAEGDPYPLCAPDAEGYYHVKLGRGIRLCKDCTAIEWDIVRKANRK